VNQVATIEGGREINPQQVFREELSRMGDQFVAALPEHIKPERFQRIVLTAVLGDPQLLRADRKSLLESAMRAAQDGLLPDKREGAFVVFNTKQKVDGKDVWVKAVQWMPMIGGIIKKMHQSGEIASISAKVVYGGDAFRAWIDDDGEHVNYEQAEHPDYDTIRQVFAFAKTKDGAVYVETLTTRDIEKIRSVSRSKDSGPWVQWWEEMAKKSAIRRLAKRLPLSSEVHDLIQRDNELYDLSQAPDPRPSLQQRLAIAKPANRDGSGYDEGFSRDFVAAETSALTDGPAGGETIEDIETSEEPRSPASADAAAVDASPGADLATAADLSGDEPGNAEDEAQPASQVTSDEDASSSAIGLPRMLMEEAIDGMLNAAMSEPAEERQAKVDKIYDTFLMPANLGPDHKVFLDRCYETVKRILGNPKEKARAREYLMGKVTA
jgi:recombination protein RecT